jgi:hypothetical protein
MQDYMEQPQQYAATQAVVSTFVSKVYGWMTIGLALTAVVALYLAANPELAMAIITNKVLFYGLLIGELLMVIALGAAIGRIPATVATAMFLVYAAANGLTIGVLFLIYTKASIATTFFVTAGTFGTMSLYGYFTKRDLTTIGNLCFMALIGLIIASVVNMFWANSTLYWIVTYAGVIIFVGLTAYDTQKIKMMALSMPSDGETVRKGAIMGALALYLDFINLFLMLLRLFGRRR